MMLRMRAAPLLLVLVFGSMQGVSFTDCPCGSLCETKNACPDEKRHESSDDCCSRTRAKDRQATENCFHLEPQSDLDQTSPEVHPVPLLILAVINIPIQVVPVSEPTSFSGRCGLSPPPPDAPLYLQHSTLLI